MSELRVGSGFDVHRFSSGRKLILGGVEIPHDKGLSGHSDADVLIHAIIDSLLGPASLPDIGMLFPDSDEKYKNVSSIKLLQDVYEKIISINISIINIDSVVICQTPKISPYVNAMKHAISSAMGGLDISRIGIKGKTSETLGFTGRGEGIAVICNSLIRLPD